MDVDNLDAGRDLPRIERLRIWAIALDVGAVASVLAAGAFAFESDAMFSAYLIVVALIAPLGAGAALWVAVRGARKAMRMSARVVAWIIVVVSGVLAVLAVAASLAILSGGD